MRAEAPAGLTGAVEGLAKGLTRPFPPICLLKDARAVAVPLRFQNPETHW